MTQHRRRPKLGSKIRVTTPRPRRIIVVSARGKYCTRCHNRFPGSSPYAEEGQLCVRCVGWW